MEKDAIFRIASQTKAIISLGIMMLQEDGLLHINEPVENILRPLMLQPWQKPTVRTGIK